MNIIEATKKAMEQDKWIFRKENPGCLFKATNTNDCFLIKDSMRVDRPYGRRWNPSGIDILADDSVG